MRAILILLAALMLGGAGGYAWSVLASHPAEQAHPRKPKMITIAPSPEELPEDQDREWAAEANDTVSYAGCNEARAAGKAQLFAGQSGYREDMNGDGDGIACEPAPGR